MLTADAECDYRTRDGRTMHFRPVCPEDEPLISDAIRTASRRTLLHRFFLPLRQLPPEELRRLLTIDPAREFCLVGETGAGAARRIVCGARYVRMAHPGTAEIAITVHDDFQRQGIGRFLLGTIAEHARHHGVHRFSAEVLAENEPMLRLLREFAPHRKSWFHDGVVHVEFDLNSFSAPPSANNPV